MKSSICYLTVSIMNCFVWFNLNFKDWPDPPQRQQSADKSCVTRWATSSPPTSWLCWGRWRDIHSGHPLPAAQSLCTVGSEITKFSRWEFGLKTTQVQLKGVLKGDNYEIVNLPKCQMSEWKLLLSKKIIINLSKVNKFLIKILAVL